MKFPYYKVIDFPKHQKRERILPWMRIGIFNTKNPSEIIYPLGLVDSGSDTTIIHRELGEELGLNIEKGKKIKISGLGGGVIKAHLHIIGFQISDLENKETQIIYQGFCALTETDFPKSIPQQTAIFGTMSFFDRLETTFRYPKHMLVKSLKDK